mmetsp:Transcript_2271/g.5360  ORF Transcript_2271/g.5360 Transcript_2271/m.5360 type:complete len:231 (-) Transcript_2271:97-789(-)
MAQLSLGEPEVRTAPSVWRVPTELEVELPLSAWALWPLAFEPFFCLASWLDRSSSHPASVRRPVLGRTWHFGPWDPGAPHQAVKSQPTRATSTARARSLAKHSGCNQNCDRNLFGHDPRASMAPAPHSFDHLSRLAEQQLASLGLPAPRRCCDALLQQHLCLESLAFGEDTSPHGKTNSLCHRLASSWDYSSASLKAAGQLRAASHQKGTATEPGTATILTAVRRRFGWC